MKRISVPACVVLALGLVIAVGSVTFLGPCVHEDGSFGSCHWAGQALLGAGGALAVQGLLALLLREPQARKGAFLAALPTALLGILLPGPLISLCRMSAMRCRAVMQPAMTLLCGAALAAALVGFWLERKKCK